MPIRAHAAFLHISKCAGSSVERGLLKVLGEGARPPVQFDRCYLAGFDRQAELSESAAASVLWDELAMPPAGARAVGHHWSLPTLLRCFAPADVSTVLREPNVRVLSYVEFARSMSQASHRHWYPDHLPAWIARAPMIDLLREPEASRAIDNLITRQVLWGNRRIPTGRFIRDTDVELLAEAAIEALEQLGFVGVIERPAEMEAGLANWLGADVHVPHENRTNVRQLPGLFRSPDELPAVRELLHERSKVDLLVWRHFAGDVAVDVDDRLARIAERSMVADYRYRTLPVGVDAPSRLELHLHEREPLPRLAPTGLLAVVSPDVRVLEASAGAHLLVQPDEGVELDIAAAFAGHDLTHVVVGPEITTVDDVQDYFDRLAAAMAGTGDLVLHLGTLRRACSPEEAVTAALRSGFHFAGVEVHERPAGWTLSLYAGVPGPVEVGTVTLPAMSSNWRRYDWPIDMDNEGDSRAVVLHLLGDARTVLELGCSAGRMTRAMQDMGLSVTAVEIDTDAAAEAAGAADETLVLDLEAPDALEKLDGQQFDLVIAADVLEHLRDPAACLAQALPLMRPGGRLIVSIPNVAHGDLRLALLEGRFEYTDIGLLDHTHISFFTHERLSAFLAEAGLWPVAWHRTRREIGETETPLRPELVEWGKLVFADDPEATTYQWIVECKRIDDVPEDERVTEHPPSLPPLERRMQHAGAELWSGPVVPSPAPVAAPTSADSAVSTAPASGLGAFIARVRGRTP